MIKFLLIIKILDLGSVNFNKISYKILLDLSFLLTETSPKPAREDCIQYYEKRVV